MYPVTLKTFPSPSWLLSSSTPPFPFCPTKTSIITHNLAALACFSADLLPFRGPRWIQRWRQTRLLLSPPSVLFPGLFSPPLSSSLSRLSSLLFLTPQLLSFLCLVNSLLLSLPLIFPSKCEERSSLCGSVLELEWPSPWKLVEMLIEYLLVKWEIDCVVGRDVGRVMLRA